MKGKGPVCKIVTIYIERLDTRGGLQEAVATVHVNFWSVPPVITLGILASPFL